MIGHDASHVRIGTASEKQIEPVSFLYSGSWIDTWDRFTGRRDRRLSDAFFLAFQILKMHQGPAQHRHRAANLSEFRYDQPGF
jgi:hypothetical protein